MFTSDFSERHLGLSSADQNKMLSSLGFETIEDFIKQVAPEKILTQESYDLPQAKSETDFLKSAKEIFSKNQIFKSYIGMGYYPNITPNVVLRNILENPAWYTAYTPYQAEISQGRMEALVNFQTMVMELTKMEIANASLLDEATAIAEAVAMAKAANKKNTSNTVFFEKTLFPQSLEVSLARAQAKGLETQVDCLDALDWNTPPFAVVLQYPDLFGEIKDYKNFVEKAHSHNVFVIVSSDLLALTLITPPGEWGADIVVGSSQRFGVPMGYGGPHAAFLATKDEYKRLVPGRIIGVSKDSKGRRAYRLSLQTREQHIRREKATSNICTAQVLLAVMASMYGVFHGPDGLIRIATRVNKLSQNLYLAIKNFGFKPKTQNYFDTFFVEVSSSEKKSILKRSKQLELNLNTHIEGYIGVSLDETTTNEDIEKIYEAFTGKTQESIAYIDETLSFSNDFVRQSVFMQQPVFNHYRSETEILRYIKSLENKDLSLVHSMIPLGSCTMKLNATSEMIPITWPEIAHLHPFCPIEQASGYTQMIQELENWLSQLTGFSATSLQPNAGSQGEYAGLLVIQKFHKVNKNENRNICLIPSSAHGTNPASAVMAGLKVVVVNCDENGNIDLDDLKHKSKLHAENLSSLMITYPSTHGVFEESITEICDIIHKNGGQVYMDGANFNAMVGLVKPGKIGPDVMHLNLHKTFCIPHGGGGPGVGPICVSEHLKEFLPAHELSQALNQTIESPIAAVSAAPFGSASILPISWSYISMMGIDGLQKASQQAIVNANYIAHRLKKHYPILYTNKQDKVAHECIIDTRQFKDYGVTVDDIAKRLIDYGFHAPTMSWPVPGTLMIEPTESESLAEIDRFCESLIAIREEIECLINKRWTEEDNPLKNAPHTIEDVVSNDWNHSYSREEAAFPKEWLRKKKFWPVVSRVDNVFGDRNFVCSCNVEDFL